MGEKKERITHNGARRGIEPTPIIVKPIPLRAKQEDQAAGKELPEEWQNPGRASEIFAGSQDAKDEECARNCVSINSQCKTGLGEGRNDQMEQEYKGAEREIELWALDQFHWTPSASTALDSWRFSARGSSAKGS